jgi:hypothetical protein
MPPKKLADGSGVPNSRTESAFVRTVDACLTVGRAADRLSDELDHAMKSGTGSGVIRVPMDEDDSLVVAVQEARAAASRLAGT